MLRSGLLVRTVFLLSRRNISNGTKNPGILRRIWDSWIPIPTSVGIALLGVLQWRRLEKERRLKRGEQPKASDIELEAYRKLPLRVMSRTVGYFCEIPLPTPLRKPVYSSYIKFFGVDTSEISEPIKSYSCFGDFFTRSLLKGARPISDSTLVSPADGTVMNCGQINSLHIDQVKGVKYSIKSFLGKPSWNYSSEIISYKPEQRYSTKEESWDEYKKTLLHNPNNELYQCVIYLSPADYHRFHSPVDWKVSFRRHFTGDLLSVNPIIANYVPDLFALNERVIYTGVWEYGFFSMAAVGATVVGSIRIYDDKKLKTNRGRKRNRVPDETWLNIQWKKGEEIGEFRLGSTIVLIFEAPKEFKLATNSNERVRVGCGLTGK